MIKSLFVSFCFLVSFVKIETKPCYTCLQGGGGYFGGYGSGYSSNYDSFGTFYRSGFGDGSQMLGNYLQGDAGGAGVDLLGAALVLGQGVVNSVYQKNSVAWDGRGFQHGGNSYLTAVNNRGSGFQYGGGHYRGGGFQHGDGFQQGSGSQHTEENGDG
nr:abscisic acid and environmental stress-inducible protein-like [Vanessa tameamea]